MKMNMTLLTWSKKKINSHLHDLFLRDFWVISKMATTHLLGITAEQKHCRPKANPHPRALPWGMHMNKNSRMPQSMGQIFPSNSLLFPTIPPPCPSVCVCVWRGGSLYWLMHNIGRREGEGERSRWKVRMWSRWEIRPSKQTAVLIRGMIACLSHKERKTFMVRVSKW